MTTTDTATQRTRTRYLTDKGRGLVGLIVLVLLVWMVASLFNRPAASPKFWIVGQQGMVYSIVVDEKVALNDAALLTIAESFLPNRPHAVMLQVWTDASLAPARILEMTDAQADARRATVTINLNSGHVSVDRPHVN